MKRLVTASALALGAYALAGWAGAVDQSILGKSLVVRNPGAADRRKISTTAKEPASPNTVVGNPTVSGGVLTVIANGTSPTTQTFNLPQGVSISGRNFWRESGVSGFKYKDGKGEQGPVRAVSIRRTTAGYFNMKAQVKAKNGPVSVVPPNPGTDGFVIFEIVGGDRYCVQFGVDGTVINKSNRLFKVSRPQLEGPCPGGGPTTTSSTGPNSTTTSTTSSTTSTTMYSSPSRAFLETPIDLLD